MLSVLSHFIVTMTMLLPQKVTTSFNSSLGGIKANGPRTRYHLIVLLIIDCKYSFIMTFNVISGGSMGENPAIALRPVWL